MKRKISPRKKISLLKKMGHSCFEYNFEFRSDIETFLNSKNEEKIIAGRIIELDQKNRSGSISDITSKINFILKNNKQNREIAKFLDVGDIIGLRGVLSTQRMMICKNLTILTKTHKPLAEEKDFYNHHGYKHLRYIVNSVDKEKIKTRIKVISLLRK